jgi:major membrane immunogen (membrane-anchored lipoprotein)
MSLHNKAVAALLSVLFLTACGSSDTTSKDSANIGSVDGSYEDTNNSNDTKLKETAPTLVSAAVSGANIILKWTHDGLTPDGGYDVHIDGADTNAKYRTKDFTATITGLDVTEKHCFNVESRYVSSKNYLISKEVCSQVRTADNDETDTGSLALRWTAPVTRADGTALEISEIDGYYIYLGESANNMQLETELSDGQAESFTFENIPVGNYFVALTVYDQDGNESDYSNIVEVAVTN